MCSGVLLALEVVSSFACIGEVGGVYGEGSGWFTPEFSHRPEGLLIAVLIHMKPGSGSSK